MLCNKNEAGFTKGPEVTAGAGATGTLEVETVLNLSGLICFRL